MQGFRPLWKRWWPGVCMPCFLKQHVHTQISECPELCLHYVVFPQVDDSFLSGNPVRSRDGRCGRDDFIPATPTDSAKTPSDLHMIHIKQELETMGSVSLLHTVGRGTHPLTLWNSLLYFKYTAVFARCSSPTV